MSVRYQFDRGYGPISAAISMFGGGTLTLGFSHVDIVLPDGRLLGARSDWIKPLDGSAPIPPGVRVRPANYEKWKRRVVFELAATKKQEASFYKFLNAQVGKPYDKLAIWAFVANRNWRDDEAWFCDELAAAATEQAGLCEQLYLPANKLTPTSWAVVVSAIGGVAQ